MVKKVVLGLVMVGLVGILVGGAILRTFARVEDGVGGQGRGLGSGDGTGTGEAQVGEWLTLQGSVVRIDEDSLVVMNDDGQEIVVENRPWWFAQKQGFAAQAGDRLTLRAFYEGDSLEVGQMANERTGQMVQLREESGRPLWAGRGRRNG